MITVSNVSLTFGGQKLFSGADLKFMPGNCYGVIGANGAGKSTFLRILSGELEPTTGTVTIPAGQRLSTLKQDQFKYDAYPVLDTVIMGNQRLYDIMKEKDELYASKRCFAMRKNPKEKKHPRIRRRVFAYLAAFVAFVLALLWLMQIVWLDDFYRWDKTRQITQAADAVESNIGNAQLSALMDRLAQQNDVCILLLDSDKHVFLSSDDIHYCLIHRMSSRDLSFWCSMIPENGDTLTELFNIAPFGGDQYNSHQFRGNVPKMEDDKKQSLLCAQIGRAHV